MSRQHEDAEAIALLELSEERPELFAIVRPVDKTPTPQTDAAAFSFRSSINFPAEMVCASVARRLEVRNQCLREQLNLWKESDKTGYIANLRNDNHRLGIEIAEMRRRFSSICIERLGMNPTEAHQLINQ